MFPQSLRQCFYPKEETRQVYIKDGPRCLKQQRMQTTSMFKESLQLASWMPQVSAPESAQLESPLDIPYPLLFPPLLSMCACSVMSNSWPPHEQQPAGLLCPWDSPGKNTGLLHNPTTATACIMSLYLACFSFKDARVWQTMVGQHTTCFCK